MRVLIVANSLLMGGAERLTVDLVGALRERGFRFVVAALRRGGVLREALQRAGATVCEGVGPRRVDPMAPLRIARLIRRHRIEAVVVLDVIRNGLAYALIGSLLSGRPVGRICWCHSSPGGKAGRFVPLLRAYRAMGLLDAVVCVSRHLRGLLRGAGLHRRTLLIRNGLDVGPFRGMPGSPLAAGLGLSAGKRVFVQVANDVGDKDFPTLLRAAGLLAGRRGDFLLLLVGRGTDSPAMAEAIRRAGAAGCVRALGHRDDVPSILAAADAFVLSTRMETFGLAVAEAMAAGLPVVASDVPAFEELFADGRHGLKAPPGDAEALAGAMERVLEEPELARRLGDSARERATAFPIQRMADRWARLLRLWHGPEGSDT